MTDERTAVLNLPLPSLDNSLEQDLSRLRAAFTAIDTAFPSKQSVSEKGAANGYAPLDSMGKVPAGNLPSFVDDVLEVANLAALPVTGEAGKIYVTLDTGRTYRWGGSAYAEIIASPGTTDAITEGSTNQFFTGARARAAQVPATTSTPGVVTIGSGLLVDGVGTVTVPFSTQAEAEAGTNNAAFMTPLRSRQAILAAEPLIRNLKRIARTANTMLVAANRGALIDITSGTFAQTFDACSALGDGWYCYLRNSGTGDATLDPNAAETIDGLTSYVMYTGETRLVQCDGTALYSVVLTSFYKVFTASGTFVKPPGYQRFAGLLWGGGGGGYGSLGGGGGACSPFDYPATSVGATQSVTIGSGAAAGNNKGGDSTFILTTQGGGPGNGYSLGGSAYGRSLVAVPYPSSVCSPSVNYATAQYAHFGGGCDFNTDATLKHSVYGGAAGGASAAGISVFGGNGGVGSGAGAIPGGGGGSTGAGARGELRIWGVL